MLSKTFAAYSGTSATSIDDIGRVIRRLGPQRRKEVEKLVISEKFPTAATVKAWSVELGTAVERMSSYNDSLEIAWLQRVAKATCTFAELENDGGSRKTTCSCTLTTTSCV